MNKSKTEQTVIVTGDIAMDWNLARARRSKSDISFWSADDTTSTTWQRGGSALLADLVEAITQKGTPATWNNRLSQFESQRGEIESRLFALDSDAAKPVPKLSTWIFAKGNRGAATGFTATTRFHLLAKNSLPEIWHPYFEGANIVRQSLDIN